MTPMRELLTAAWYGDRALAPAFPPGWDATVDWPRGITPITDAQIADALERPVDQPPVLDLCRGKSRALVIVDDLTRPTPAYRVMPILLNHFRDAGVEPEQVRVLMATGTHGPPPAGGIEKKIGSEPANRCQVLVHHHHSDGVEIGETSFGTPVVVNRAVLESDFVVGVGGIFPSSNLGFSGGSKLALGVLGFRSVAALHAKHPDVPAGVIDRTSSFRKDLDEIAERIGLRTMVSIHVDLHRQPVRVTCGDHFSYIEEEMSWAREHCVAPAATDADVVVCNAYPSDLSLTIARNKGTWNFYGSPRMASRVLIASCAEGMGQHGLFPLVRRSPPAARRDRLRRILSMGPVEIARKVAARAAHSVNRVTGPAPTGVSRRHPLWLYRPGEHPEALPREVAGMRITPSWLDIVSAVHAEQGNREGLRVVLYPCAPLQCVDRPG